MTAMRQVRVRVLWPVLGFTPDQVVTLARTELVDALLDRGYLTATVQPDDGARAEATPGAASAADGSAASPRRTRRGGPV